MLLFAAAFFCVLGVLEVLSLKARTRGLEHSMTLSRHLAEPGESFTLTSRVSSTRLLPVGFFALRETLPQDIVTSGDLPGFSLSRLSGVCSLTRTGSLMPRSHAEAKLELSLPHRGRYYFSGAEISCGDLLGFRRTSRTLDTSCELIVYPARAQSAECDFALGSFLGDISVRRFIIEDPMLTVGFHEYTGSEPMRDISWTRSAQSMALAVKTYDHTSDTSLCVLLDVEQPDGRKNALTERAFELTRTVCEKLESERISYGIETNASCSGAAGSWSRIGEGLGKGHIESILEGLGRADMFPTEPFSRTLSRAARSCRPGMGYIIISARRREDLESSIASLENLSSCPCLRLCAEDMP